MIYSKILPNIYFKNVPRTFEDVKLVTSSLVSKTKEFPITMQVVLNQPFLLHAYNLLNTIKAWFDIKCFSS